MASKKFHLVASPYEPAWRAQHLAKQGAAASVRFPVCSSVLAALLILSQSCLRHAQENVIKDTEGESTIYTKTVETLLEWKSHLESSNSLMGDSRFHTWDRNTSMCRDWIGTYCNMGGELDMLVVQGEWLRGTLPPQLSLVTSLTNFLAENNAFYGTLPVQWRTLKLMTALNLDMNSVSGSLPGSWRTMRRLESVQLKNNRLVTTLPASWSTMKELYFIDLSNNKNVTGKLPHSWSTMGELKWLDLVHLTITGSLPAVWNEGMTTLERLDLRKYSGHQKPRVGELKEGSPVRICQSGPVPVGRLWTVAKLDPCPV